MASILLYAGLAVLRSSLERTESRPIPFAFNRVDYPEQDDANWKVFLAIQKDAEGAFELRKFPADGAHGDPARVLQKAAATAMGSKGLKHRTLTPSGFGWELESYDPASVLDAFRESGGLILIRGQSDLTTRELAGFAALFGELEKNEKYDPDFLLPSRPEILRIGNLRENGKYCSLFTRADPPPLLWHCDDSFRKPQPLGSCILCVETPPEGGETGFAGMAAAYDALPADTKKRIDGLTTTHSYHYLDEYLRRENPHRPPLSDELRAQHPPVERPLVARHPQTGLKSLYIPKCHIESVDGLSPHDGETLLTELLDHATGPDFALMHRWSAGDLVVWDNRCTLHAPTPFDDAKYDRLLYRLTMTGEQIV